MAEEEQGDPLDVTVKVIPQAVQPELTLHVTIPGIEVDFRVLNEQGFQDLEFFVESFPTIIRQALEAAVPQEVTGA